MSSIWKEAGLAGFYRGYGAQIARDVPFRVVQLVAYEFTKKLYINLRDSVQATATKAKEAAKELKQQGKGGGGSGTSLEAWEGALVGAVAGSFSAAVTTPLDVLKTRMMTGRVPAGASGVLSAARLIVAEEGVGALFKGLSPRVGLIGPSCAVFFMVYEFVHNNFPMDA